MLERGHIVESGRHEELLQEKGLYYAMWRQQVGERRAAAAMAVPPRRHEFRQRLEADRLMTSRPSHNL